jgi:hypothetical protein
VHATAFFHMTLSLDHVAETFADALVAIDSSKIAFRNFLPGVGPYGEPQLLSGVADRLNATLPRDGEVCTKRTPDLLISAAKNANFIHVINP